MPPQGRYGNGAYLGAFSKMGGRDQYSVGFAINNTP